MAEITTVSALAHRRVEASQPAAMACPTLSVREHPGLAILALTVDIGRHRELGASLVAALGALLPAPDVPSGNDPLLIWQGPNDCLVVGEPQAVAARAVAVEGAIAGRAALLVDVSDGLVAIDLTGPDALSVCPPPWPGRLDGPRSAVGRLADLRVTKLFLGEESVRLFVERPDADYLWAWLKGRMATLG